MSIITVCFIIHIIFIAILLILKVLHILKTDFIMILIAFLVPIWGTIMLFAKLLTFRKEAGRRYQVEVARMYTDDAMKSVDIEDRNVDVVPIQEAMIMNDSDYQKELMKDILYDVSSIVIDPDDVVEKVVPIQEAMILNDAATKRALIMDILYTNPSDYISLLSEAKNNDDTEVVHYAVTALVEMQKEYDLKFQDVLKRKAENPDDEAIDKEYLRLQERYISCGLLDGDGLRTQQLNYRNHLLELIDKGNRTWTIQCKLADIDLQLKDIDELAKDVKQMEERWPNSETTYVYRLHLAILRKDIALVRQIIAEIEEKDIYLSSELRDIIQFWSDENEKKIG